MKTANKVESILLVGFLEARFSGIARKFGEYESVELNIAKISAGEVSGVSLESISSEKYDLLIVSSVARVNNLKLYNDLAKGAFLGNVLIMSDDKNTGFESASGNVWRMDVGSRDVVSKVEEILGLDRKVTMFSR